MNGAGYGIAGAMRASYATATPERLPVTRMEIGLTPTIFELRLLTHRPTRMVAWWAAFLGTPAVPVGERKTAITTGTLRIVIERSEIAADQHPQAGGVMTIGVTPGPSTALLDAVGRLAELGSRPHRATYRSDETHLWYRAPNGIDVTVGKS
jgi:hypothetical protein